MQCRICRKETLDDPCGVCVDCQATRCAECGGPLRLWDNRCPKCDPVQAARAQEPVLKAPDHSKGIGAGVALAIGTWIAWQMMMGSYTRPEPPGVPYSAQASIVGSAPAAAGKPELEILGYKYEREGGLLYTVGTARNNTDREAAYAQVTFPVYDEAGVQVETAMTNVTDLQPHTKWRFKALIGSKDVHHTGDPKVTGWQLKE
jgi:hypothetical protein